MAAVPLVFVPSVLFSRCLRRDTYYDLYVGRYIINRGILDRNVVRVVPHGAPWIDQQWLPHVMYHRAWAAGGYPALTLLPAALVTYGFGVLALLMLSRGAAPAGMDFGKAAWRRVVFQDPAGLVLARQVRS